jgi:hypothetical protein
LGAFVVQLINPAAAEQSARIALGASDAPQPVVNDAAV